MTFQYKARFTKAFQRLPLHEQTRVGEAVEQVCTFFESRQAPEGLGLKKLFSRERLGAVCEARAGLSLRILFSIQENLVTFLIVGSHDEVRRFIRSFR